jgi:hypothetical protein
LDNAANLRWQLADGILHQLIAWLVSFYALKCLVLLSNIIKSHILKADLKR